LQNNCLATYVDTCVKGVSSIWLLRKKVKDYYKNLITIEVVDNTVSQVKGKVTEHPEHWNPGLYPFGLKRII